MRWPSGPTPRGSTSRRVLRAHDLPLFSVDTHRPAGAFDLLAFNLSAELVYTNLLNCIDLAGVPVRAADRRPEHPLVVAGGHCTYNPEPLADFLDVVVLGDGEEVVGEITEVVAEWKASGPHRGLPRAGAAAAGPGPGRLRAVDVRRDLRGRAPGGRHAPLPGRARAGREAHDRRPGRLALSQAPARPAHRGRPRPPQRRGVPRLHPRLPLLPGRHDHPARPRAPGRPGAHDDRPRAYAAPATTRSRSPRCRRPTSRGIEKVVADTVNDPTSRQPGLGVAARACGSTPSPSASPPSCSRPAAPASRSRPRPARGACARSSTS